MGCFLLLDYNSWLCFISILRLQFCCFLTVMTTLTCALVLAARKQDPRLYDEPADIFRGICEAIAALLLGYYGISELNQLRMWVWFFFFAVFDKCMFMEWLEDAYWDSYLLNLHGSTPQGARKRLVLQVVEWLTASLYQERSQTWVDYRYITGFKTINESAAMYSLLSARKRSP